MSDDLRQAKAELRARMAAARDAIPPAERARASAAILERLLALPEWQAAGTVFVYVSFRSEVDTRGILSAALARGRVCGPARKSRVLVPRVVRARGEIDACEIYSLDDLAPGGWGILEPADPAAPAADPSEVDLVILPGLAFDAAGARLGYGAGYYDRYLRRTRPDCARVAVAYQAQILPEVPAGPHDERVGAIVTEDRVYRREMGQRENGSMGR